MMKLRRGDIMLIGIVLLCAIIFIIIKAFPNEVSDESHSKIAKITVDGKIFRTVELTAEPQEIKVETEDGHYNLLKVHDHGIEMIDADCPDKVCLTFGFITNPSQTIVCLPHRVLVEIENNNPMDQGDDIDAVVK
ncbi:NusG domain II-containing protein [Paenibacillus guangzhouensis]|uniref:NusG domain II-containing protein n=1 Tax=Paenibacillus guangzhouensis TaxID=1473112 RepID=UPI0012673AF7|nr:NusG domain II-containing protein [Paenibacillus guangzhouensis]